MSKPAIRLVDERGELVSCGRGVVDEVDEGWLFRVKISPQCSLKMVGSL